MGNCSKEKILKIFTGCLGTETHTAAPLPTDMAAFETSHLVRGGAHGEPLRPAARGPHDDGTVHDQPRALRRQPPCSVTRPRPAFFEA